MTLELISHSLPFTTDPSTTAYRTVLTESMCSFCLELLSLPSLPKEKINEGEHSHYFVAKNLLKTLYETASRRTPVILKSYLNILKHLQYSYMTEEELELLLELMVRLEELCFNASTAIVSAMKSVEEQIQSCLALIDKYVR